MKHSITFIFLILLQSVACNNSTSELYEENFKDENNKTVEYVEKENNVYLDDMIVMLKNRTWTKEEEPCINDILIWIRTLRNFTLWAVWDWDAQPSESQGLLFGNRYQLGNYDQCMNVAWSTEERKRNTQYCLADIVLERNDKSDSNISNEFSPYQSALDFMEFQPAYSRPFNELTWGTCLPQSCSPRTVERLLEVMIARSHLGIAGLHANIEVKERDCQRPDSQMELGLLFYWFVGIFGFLTAICVVCTFINHCKMEQQSEKRKINIISAFCLKENLKDLARVPNEDFKVLYGIRFLSICFIVLDHQLGISNSGPISDGYTSDKASKSFIGYLILHDDLFVDTFFFLSGCLAFITLSKFKQLPNPFLAIFKRYIRLVVGLSVVIFYICAVFPYTGTGPLWPKGYSYETVQCNEYWWINILMLNNYVETENICIVNSWYIPCDFHFSVIIILLFWLYRRSPTLAGILFSTLAVLSIIIPGLITYVKKFSAIQVFNAEFVVNPRRNEQFNTVYIKSHTRFAAYLVGVTGGYIHTKYNNSSGNFKKISKKWAIPGTISAITLLVLVMVTGCGFLWRSYDPLESAIYAALNRPAWAFAIGVLVLCSSHGDVPIVKSFLSWNAWVPLSRLAYGLYLTHSLIITRNVFIARNARHNDYLEILNSTVSVIFWGSIASLLIWLIVEAPVNNLVVVAIKARLSKQVKQLEVTAPRSENSRVRNQC